MHDWSAATTYIDLSENNQVNHDNLYRITGQPSTSIMHTPSLQVSTPLARTSTPKVTQKAHRLTKKAISKSQPLNLSSAKNSANIATEFLNNSLTELGIKSNKNNSVSFNDTPQPASQDLLLALTEPDNEIENEREPEAVATAQKSHNKNNKSLI